MDRLSGLLSGEELSSLKEQCLKARELSYSPYSKFRVGCTLLTESHSFISGANVENASYGAGICAERVTITKAMMEGHKKYKVIAISGDSDDPISPCGICRQFIRELNKSVLIVMYSKSGDKVEVMSLEELLPKSFGPENLL